MLQLPINRDLKAQLLHMLLWSLFLASTISALPASTTSDPVSSTQTTDLFTSDFLIPVSEPTHTRNSHYTESKPSRILKYFLGIAAIIIISFCVAFTFLERCRRNAKLSAREEDVEVAEYSACQGYTPSEGLDDQGEAPPPYAPSSKPPSSQQTERTEGQLETNEVTRSHLEPSSVEPPPYNGQTINIRNEDNRDSGPTRPLSCFIPSTPRYT